jgi:isocitrate/isopropylmalate dehydrogenase
MFCGASLEDGVDRKYVTVRATSRKTPSVYKDVDIAVVREAFTDIHVDEGKYHNNFDTAEKNDREEYINLHLTNGGNVKIDTTKETVWYEG